MFRFFLFLIGLFTFLHSGEITTPPTQLAKTDSALLEGGVACCFIESTNQVFYTWAQTGLDEGPSQPYFALYNPLQEKFIIEKQLINQDYTDGVNIGVNCCYDSASNQVILCWADGTDDTKLTYIIYDVATQTFAPVKKIDESSAVLSVVGCCYNKTTNKVIFSWENNTTSKPVYTILSSDGYMTSPQNISTNQAFNSVYCCSAKSDKVIFSFSSSEKDKIFIDVLNLNTLGIEEFELNFLPTKLSADVFCSYNSDSN